MLVNSEGAVMMKILTNSFWWFVVLHGVAVMTLMWAQSKGRKTFQRCVVVLWPLLLAISIWWGWGNVAELKNQERSVTQAPYFRCLYYRFPDGDVLSEKRANEGRGDPHVSSPTMLEDPPGCMADFQGFIKERPPHVIIFTGRADRRELARTPADKYASNEALAYQRAKSVKDLKAKEWKGQSILMAAGPIYFNGLIDTRLMERDRSVEIRAYWEPPQAQESSSALGTLFNVDRELALLGVIIALSTYLAAVGFFVRQRINELAKTAPATCEIAKKKLRLLVLADLPLILSGLLLFLHVYYSWYSLRSSMQLLAMGAVTLVLYHSSQWWQSGRSWWKV